MLKNTRLAESIEQALERYEPSFMHQLRYNLELSIRRNYDHFENEKMKSVVDLVLEPMAKLCAIVEAELFHRDEAPNYISPVVSAYLGRDYFGAIREFCPEAVTDFQYRGAFYDARAEQRRLVERLDSETLDLIAR